MAYQKPATANQHSVLADVREEGLLVRKRFHEI